MSSTPRPLAASLLLTTYEMPRHLALVLAGLERQSTDQYEIFVCDDGSGAETAKIIEEFSKRSPVPVHHLWQQHEGFRKCRILNQALGQARGKTLIFLDGDCIPHRHYIHDHINQQAPGYYLAGRRVELGPWISERLTPKKIQKGFFDFPAPQLIWSVLKGDSDHLQRSLRIPWEGLRKKLGMYRVDDMKGCNYSVSREDLESINGFDEDYEGYGREDTDVELRLQNLGLRIKSIKGLALQFHIWHPRREFTPANDERLEELKRTRQIRCKNGLIHRPTP